MKQFRGGLIFKSQRLVYHATLGSRGINEKKMKGSGFRVWGRRASGCREAHLTHRVRVRPHHVGHCAFARYLPRVTSVSTFVSLNSRLKGLRGPVSRVTKKAKKGTVAPPGAPECASVPRDAASGGKSMCFQSQFHHKSVNSVRIPNKKYF